MTELNTTLNDKDMLVIRAMLDNSHVQPSNVTTVEQLTNEIDENKELESIPRSTTYRVVRKLLGNGCLKEAHRDKRTKRFYVTLEGIKLYTSLSSISLETKSELIEEYMKLEKAPVTQNWHDMFEEVYGSNEDEQ